MLKVPPSITEEHHHVRLQVRHAAALGGETGKAAERLSSVLLPHMEKEERLALPLLGFLRDAALEEVPHRLGRAGVPLGQFRQMYPGLLVDHAQIVALLAGLQEAAVQEGHREVADLARGLAHHARLEEEVLYPAALLLERVLEQAAALSRTDAVG